jgi:hypothetical protein
MPYYKIAPYSETVERASKVQQEMIRQLAQQKM